MDVCCVIVVVWSAAACIRLPTPLTPRAAMRWAALSAHLCQQLLRNLLVEESRPLHRNSSILPRARLGLVEKLLSSALPINLLVDSPLVLPAVPHDPHFGHIRSATRLRCASKLGKGAGWGSGEGEEGADGRARCARAMGMRWVGWGVGGDGEVGEVHSRM